MKLTILRASLALTALLPLGTSFVPAGSAANQDPQSTNQVDLYGRPLRKATEDLSVRMRGCWQITDLDNREWPNAGRDLLGYLLITDGFLSFEVQAFWDTRNQDIPDAYQTFLSRFTVDRTGKVLSESLIGSFLDREQGSLEWENPGLPREFVAVMPNDSTLEIEWGNGSRMTFARLTGARTTTASFFGQPSSTDLGAERDLFGRERKSSDDEDQDR